VSPSFAEVDKAWNSFYLEYGPAMLAWQLVESELATLFSKITKIPPDMAIQIFYSATSFNGRIAFFSISHSQQGSRNRDSIRSFPYRKGKKLQRLSQQICA
jgi:hypothetical protein